MDFEVPEEPQRTKADLLNIFDGLRHIVDDICNKYEEGDEVPRFRAYDRIVGALKELQKMEEIRGFEDVLLKDTFANVTGYLITSPNTEISALFVGILIDLCENDALIERLRRSDLLMHAIESCAAINEVRVQTDAQFLYNTLTLLSTILDGCDEGKEFASKLIRETKLLNVIKRQFERDDFDENVQACAEIMSILLQLDRESIAVVDAGVLHMLLRFCANERNPESSGEDEAAHNAFNIVTLFALDKIGNEHLVELRGIEILLTVWSSSAATSRLSIKVIEAAVCVSPACCVQFVEAGGLKKLFGAFRIRESRESIVAILDALLITLPVDSSSFRRVIRKFCERNFEKVSLFFEICEFVAASQEEDGGDDDDEEEDTAFSMLMLCCSAIAVLFLYAPADLRVSLVAHMLKSDAIDLETVVDTAELRVADNRTGLERVHEAITVLRELGSKMDS